MNDGIKKFFFDSNLDDDHYIYGTGGQTRILVDLLNSIRPARGGKIAIFVGEDGKIEPTISSDDTVIMNIDDLPIEKRANVHVLISAHHTHNTAIMNRLQSHGYRNIYFSDNWVEDNHEIRSIILDKYIQSHNMSITGDAISYQCDGIDFKIAFPKSNNLMTSAVMGEWGDIVKPSIFGEYDVISEGAYELGRVCLSKGDVVIDCGANIGVFSCVAAAKGCNVYAFEPNENIYNMLLENQKLNKNISAQKSALSDFIGEASFYETPIAVDADLGTSTLLQGRRSKYKETKVECITLDEFAERNQLSHVDFIKADIEGAERQMLKGAKRVLKEFAPKLALCTYHLPDDPEVMEQLILEANPRYKIEHRWKKLYAYVE